jgi:hypothetical protein
MKLAATFILVYICFITFSQSDGLIERIRGVSLTGSRYPVVQDDFDPIVSLHANWVTLMPYAFVNNDSVIEFDTKWQWRGEKTEGIKEAIELSKANNLKVMLKPHVWIRGQYTGDFELISEEGWQSFEKSYRSYMLHFAKIAGDCNLPLLCIGTEWREFVKERPEFWRKLILEIKVVYKGELTYAANWDDYKVFPHWSLLSYIGVDAYFPLSSKLNPTLKEIARGWDFQSIYLKEVAMKHAKKILFTEIGYRSLEGTLKSPWEHNKEGAFDQDIQALAYQALFNKVWEKEWFAGAFIWKWFSGHKHQGGNSHTGFTPQNKKAEEIIRRYWRTKK